MSPLNLALFVIGGLTLLLSLTAGFVEKKAYLSQPFLATLLGVLVGPAGLGLLDLADWGDPRGILEAVARLTVAVAVMASALRLPSPYFRPNARALTLVLSVGMLGMWLISGLLAYALLGLPFWVATLLGAVVTPTDPVLAGTIVTGGLAEKKVPARLRNFITAEAGANDGGAYPFVFLAVLMLEHPPGEALTAWLTRVLLWEVLGAVVLGSIIGYVVGRLERLAHARGLLGETSVLTGTVALSAFVLGAVKLMGSDGILAVFVAGVAYNRVANKNDEAREENVQEAVNRLFTFPVFVFFGSSLPWAAWQGLGLPGVALAALVLLLRRPPVLLLLAPRLKPLRGTADALFSGWFGPIGVAALFYATLSVRETGLEVVWEAASLIIFASVVLHGVTATPFTKLLGRVQKGRVRG